MTCSTYQPLETCSDCGAQVPYSTLTLRCCADTDEVVAQRCQSCEAAHTVVADQHHARRMDQLYAVRSLQEAVKVLSALRAAMPAGSAAKANLRNAERHLRRGIKAAAAVKLLT